MKKPDPIKVKFNAEVNRTAAEIAIRKRGAEITQKATTHFEKNQGKWINRRYGELLKSNSAPSMQLTPHGQQLSPSQKATKAARIEIDGNFKKRLSNIQNKVENMVARSKSNDPTRPRGMDKDKER